MSRLGVITNPTSGSGRGRASGVQALTELAAFGHQVHDLSQGSWAASYEAAMRVREDIDALVVVGGDGMVHLGLQVCAQTELPLGIVAAGSGDDIASTCGLPVHDVKHAVAAVHEGLQGKVTRIDLGRVTGQAIELPAAPRYFGAVFSAGIDAAIAARARVMTRPRGPLKYKVATMAELPRFAPYQITITADGRTWDQDCTLVAVANGRVFGGGLVISPKSDISDGKLELVLAEPLSIPSILKLFPKLGDGSHVSDPRVSIFKVDSVTLVSRGDTHQLPPAFADGELVGAEPMTIDVVPQALTVLGAQPR